MSGKKTLIIMLLFFSAVGLRAELVCTFHGKGEDAVHEIAVSPGGITITLPAGETAKQVFFDKDEIVLETTDAGEIVLKPKTENLRSYLSIISNEGFIYILHLCSPQEGNPLLQAHERMVIKTLNQREQK